MSLSQALNQFAQNLGRYLLQTLTPEQRAPIRVADGDGARWIDSCVGRWRPNAERVLTGSTSSVG